MKIVLWIALLLLYMTYVPLFLMLAEGLYEAVFILGGIVSTQWLISSRIDE